MKLRLSRSRAATSATLMLFVLAALAPAAHLAPARHPVYGGTLRVEMAATVTSLDAGVAAASEEEAAAKSEIESLLYERRNADGSFDGVAGSGPFRISEWEPGKHLTLTANDDFSGGRPFLDAIEISMGHSARDSLLDLTLGRTDFIEISPEQARQATARGIRVSATQPDELIALVFLPGHPASSDVRAREAVAQSIDRAAIVEFILQKEGEPAGGLLPQWSSGTAFLFPTAADEVRAKELRSQIGASGEIRLGYDAGDNLEESIAERIAVNTRDAGLELTTAPAFGTRDDAKLVRLPMISPHAGPALENFLTTLGPLAGIDATAADVTSPEKIFARERTALDGFRVVPLVWLPRVYGLSERVRDWRAPSTDEPWPLADVWLEAPAGKQN